MLVAREVTRELDELIQMRLTHPDMQFAVVRLVAALCIRRLLEKPEYHGNRGKRSRVIKAAIADFESAVRRYGVQS